MKEFKSYLIITLGVIIVGAGLSFFLIPANLATGGITGLAMVINEVIPTLDFSLILLVLNLILFVVGFLAIGSSFGAKTIYASFLLTGTIFIFDTLFPVSGAIVEDLLVNLIVGIVIQGIGLGIVFNENASTGGTDIIAKVLNLKYHIEMGKSLQIADFVVVVLASFVFGIELAIYALLGIVLNGFIIDNVIEGFNLKISVSVISSKSDEIQKFIVNDLDRGATIYLAKGAYTQESKEIVNSVMNKKEFIRVKNYVKAVDPNAFVMTSNVREVMGEGFYS